MKSLKDLWSRYVVFKHKNKTRNSLYEHHSTCPQDACAAADAKSALDDDEVYDDDEEASSDEEAEQHTKKQVGNGTVSSRSSCNDSRIQLHSIVFTHRKLMPRTTPTTISTPKFTPQTRHLTPKPSNNRRLVAFALCAGCSFNPHSCF